MPYRVDVPAPEEQARTPSPPPPRAAAPPPPSGRGSRPTAPPPQANPAVQRAVQGLEGRVTSVRPSSPPPTARPAPPAATHTPPPSSAPQPVVGAKQVYVQVRRTLFVDADATRGQQRGTKEVQIGMTVEIPDELEAVQVTENTYRAVSAQAWAFVNGMD